MAAQTPEYTKANPHHDLGMNTKYLLDGFGNLSVIQGKDAVFVNRETVREIVTAWINRKVE